MQNVHIRDSDIRAGYAFPREPGLFHSGVLAGGGAEVRVPNIRTVAPAMGFFLLGLQCLPHLGGIVPFPSPYHTHLYVELF
jgi:hypothetical protein